MDVGRIDRCFHSTAGKRTLCLVFFSVPVFGQQVPLVVAWLAIGALFFTLYLDSSISGGFGWQFVTYGATSRTHQPR